MGKVPASRAGTCQNFTCPPNYPPIPAIGGWAGANVQPCLCSIILVYPWFSSHPSKDFTSETQVIDNPKHELSVLSLQDCGLEPSSSCRRPDPRLHSWCNPSVIRVLHFPGITTRQEAVSLWSAHQGNKLKPWYHSKHSEPSWLPPTHFL